MLTNALENIVLCIHLYVMEYGTAVLVRMVCLISWIRHTIRHFDMVAAPDILKLEDSDFKDIHCISIFISYNQNNSLFVD